MPFPKLANQCPHGYGGFFKCPKGCHSKGPVEDLNELDRNIDYFQKRSIARGLSKGYEEPKRDPP